MWPNPQFRAFPAVSELFKVHVYPDDDEEGGNFARGLYLSIGIC